MTIALIDSPARASNSPKMNALEVQNDKDLRAEPSEFGHVMSGILNPTAQPSPSAAQALAAASAEAPALNGQAMADSGLGLSSLMNPLGGDFLKAVHLGPHLNVITPETAAPDKQSLEAFARSQGLDETAVQWLMGTVPVMPPLGLALPKAEAAATAGSGATGDFSTALSSEKINTFDGTPATAGGLSAATTVDPLKSAAAQKPDTQITAIALGGAALWAMAQATEPARTAPASAQAMSEAGQVQINLMTPPAPTAMWMLRNAINVSPAKEVASAKTDIALSEIDLSQEATPELLESLAQSMESGASEAHPTPLSGHPGHRLEMNAAKTQDPQTQADNPTASDTGSAQRSEKVHELAEKMGQAVGKRILSEMEKGQWHLKLSLRPATLGHIEVEMRMRSGELDAVFTANQALTRELLQDGMSKLKDTLNQMGMDVASMQVGDGQTQKRGGESTPGQMSKSTNTENGDSKSTQAQAISVPRMKMGQDGWDVLV
jgi:flagellar hook-length control protein FliK